MSANISDASGIKKAEIFYRMGGAVSYQATPMTDAGSNQFTGTIPLEFVTPRGVEYYILAEDNAGNKSTFPTSNADENPQVVRVEHSNLSFTNSTSAGAYRMISIPFDLDSSTPSSVLDELGNYDDSKWRLLRYVNGVLLEHTKDSNVGNFDPGLGFWLITKNSTSLDAGAGKSVSTSGDFRITLQPGWNQIGNPFVFPVSWSDVDLGPDVENQLHGYQGSKNESAGYVTRTQLAPFEGYFVNNNGNNVSFVKVQPQAASGNIVAKRTSNVVGNADLQSNEWLAQISVETERYIDGNNFIGALYTASDEWDQNDFSEPPFCGKYVSLYFPHPEWQKFSRRYSGDFRNVNTTGHSWHFNVGTNLPFTDIRMTLVDLQNMPQGWEIFLVDAVQGNSIDLTREGKYHFVSGREGTVRKFTLIAGPTESAEGQIPVLTEIPEDFQLFQNFPNPFNPSTNIRYAIPAGSSVRLAIYNLGGQLIQELYDGHQAAGRYELTWDGNSENGNRVSSGLYLVRLTAGKYVKTIKVIVEK